jgi:hypothetical protein
MFFKAQHVHLNAYLAPEPEEVESVILALPERIALRPKSVLINIFSMLDDYDPYDTSFMIDAIDNAVVADPQSTVADETIAKRLSESDRVDGQSFFDGSLNEVTNGFGEARNIFLDH